MNKKDYFAELPGLVNVKRAMEVAVAGGHSIGIIDCNGYNAEYHEAFRRILTAHEDTNAFLRVVACCPCGNMRHPSRVCSCTSGQIKRYYKLVKVQRVLNSEIVVEAGYVHNRDFNTNGNEPAAIVRERIQHMAKGAGDLTLDALKLLNTAYERLNMNAVGRDTAVRIADTIARLDGSGQIEARHIAEAVQYFWRGEL